MASTALTSSQPKQRRERPIGRKLQQAVSLLLDGSCKSQKAVCDRLNLSPSYLSRSLKNARIRVFIAQETARTLAAGALPATATVLRLAESARPEHVMLDAAKHVLALGGHSPPKDSRGVTINAEGGGYVIVLQAQGADVLEGDVVPGVGGVLIGRPMTPDERRDGLQERGRDLIDVTPPRAQAEQSSSLPARTSRSLAAGSDE